MLLKVVLDNEEYNILYSPIKVKENVKLYFPLVRALWSKISDSQKKSVVIITDNKNNKIINFDSLIQCYAYSRQDTLDYGQMFVTFILDKKECNENNIKKYKSFNDNIYNCACGVKIMYKNIIRNIDTDELFIIGSDCIKWWKYDKKIIK